MTTHVVTVKRHKEFAASASSASTRSVASYFRPEEVMNVFEAETRWALCLLLSTIWLSYSVIMPTSFFAKMFPDLEIARKFGCGRTK